MVVVPPKGAWDNVWDPLTVAFRSKQLGTQLDDTINRILEQHHQPPIASKGTLLE